MNSARIRSVKRRELFAVVVGFAVFAGCLNHRHEIHLARIAIGNFTPTSKQFKIVVRYNNSVIHKKTYRIEGDDDDDMVVPSVTIADELPEEPGTYTVKYGFPGGSLETFEASERITGDCGQFEIDIREGPSINTYFASSCDTLTVGNQSAE